MLNRSKVPLCKIPQFGVSATRSGCLSELKKRRYKSVVIFRVGTAIYNDARTRACLLFCLSFVEQRRSRARQLRQVEAKPMHQKCVFQKIVEGFTFPKLLWRNRNEMRRAV